MNQAEFERWQSLLEERTGVWLPEHRKPFLLSSLATRMRARGFKDYDSYFHSLVNGSWAAVEWTSLVDLLTVHETRFFRDQDSLELVRQHCRDHLQKRTRDGSTANLQLWSVGCSTGEEVYTLAMMAQQFAEEMPVYFGVTGMDISFPALAVAREGIYPQRRLQEIPSKLRQLFFKPKADAQYQVSDALRKRTCFVQGNVQELTLIPQQVFDVIYCQNVLIYFQKERRHRILQDMVERLAPGGLLVLGPGEVTGWHHSKLERVNNKHCLAFTRCGEDRK